MVIAPARTGKLIINKTAVMATLHRKSGKRAKIISSLGRLIRIVVRKLILPKIEETPARCRAKIARSTDTPLWNFLSDRGG